MALQKSEVQPTGQTGDYWKISAYEKRGNNITFSVELYKDQAARQADATPMTIKRYVVDVPAEADVKQVDKSLLTELYAHLKTLSEFSGAIDIDPDV